MKLIVGRIYRISFSDDSYHDALVISDEGNGWYKVKSANAKCVVFINLNQATSVRED
jgi:hypothetical protein